MTNAKGDDVRLSQSDKLMFSAVSAVTVALLLWVGSTLSSNQVQLGQLQVELMRLRADFNHSADTAREFDNRLRIVESDVAAVKTRQGLHE